MRHEASRLTVDVDQRVVLDITRLAKLRDLGHSELVAVLILRN